MTTTRKDTHKLKSQLLNALGEQGRTYWMMLIRFLNGSATRSQLNESTIYFTPEHMKMHNTLMFAILENAQSAIICKCDGESDFLFDKTKPRVFRRQYDVGGDDKRCKFISRLVLTMNMEERSRLFGMQSLNVNEQHIPIDTKQSQGADDVAPPSESCTDEMGLPCYDHLKDRIQYILTSNGVDSIVPQEAIQLLEHGIEVKVKDMVERIQDGKYLREPKDNNEISVHDIDFAFNISRIVDNDTMELVKSLRDIQ